MIHAAVALTEVETQPSVLHLVLRLRMEARVMGLVHEMMSSKLIPQEPLNEFITEFATQNSNNREEHEWISLQFSYLLNDIIEPALLTAGSTRDRLTLTEFHQKVMGFLEETVPKGETVDQFLETYRQFSSERVELKTKYANISKNSAETMRIAAETAKKIHAKMVAEFEALKVQLKAVHNKKRAVFTELTDILKELESRIKNVDKTLMQMSQEQAKIGQQMKVDSENFNQIATLYEQVLKKVEKL